MAESNGTIPNGTVVNSPVGVVFYGKLQRGGSNERQRAIAKREQTGGIYVLRCLRWGGSVSAVLSDDM